MNSSKKKIDVEGYLKKFNYGKSLSLEELWKEIDSVWLSLELDNRSELGKQDVGAFYSHPVWILNGLFTEFDSCSIGHRKAIAKYILSYPFENVDTLEIADFGGGSGVLAREIYKLSPGPVKIDIIEPWPTNFFENKLKNIDSIKYNKKLSKHKYNVVVVQDVLEHIENPINIAIECINSVKNGGIIVFANCFKPVIKCHLPKTFYLRHTFKYIFSTKSITYLEKIKGAEHAQVFHKKYDVKIDEIRKRIIFAKIFGPFLNLIGMIRSRIKELIKFILRKCR